MHRWQIKNNIMARRKKELSHEERVAALKQRIVAKVAPVSKVVDARGHKLGSVSLRWKVISGGTISLYLDLYLDGKRKYDFLNLYLDPALVVSEKEIGIANENAIMEAESRRAAKIEDIKCGKNITAKAAMRSKMLLIDWLRHYSQNKKETGRSDSFGKNIDKTILRLVQYSGDKVTIGEVDKEFCEAFLAHLATTPTRNQKPLSKATQAHYYKLFRMALTKAVKENVIEQNHALEVDKSKRPRVSPSTREFLSVEEVKALIDTDCANNGVKRAYLFSCFCGLRHSDITNLTWGDIVTRGGIKYIEIRMKKTDLPLSVPLSDEALALLPNRGEAKSTDKVFSLPSLVRVNTILREWAAEAGITKHLSFHTSRHTFATLGLTAGVDLYTVSKLLGHTNIKTTQIYAKIIDKKKDEATQQISKLFK